MLVADDLSLKVIDLGKCRLLSMDFDINQDSDRGMTAQVDIHHLGNIFYSIACWKKYEPKHCSKEEDLPSEEELPDVRNVFCGDIIQNCWSSAYSFLQELYDAASETLWALSKELLKPQALGDVRSRGGSDRRQARVHSLRLHAQLSKRHPHIPEIGKAIVLA